MTWKINGSGSPIVEVWEDFQGNLWFVAERLVDTDFDKENELCYGFARLRHMPECAEWGTFGLKEIREAQRAPTMLWPVTKGNWGNINSYEDGLFVKV